MLKVTWCLEFPIQLTDYYNNTTTEYNLTNNNLIYGNILLTARGLISAYCGAPALSWLR